MGSFQDPAVFLTTQRASMVQFVVAQFYGVPVEELRKPTRGRPHVARARQISMHLARSVFAMSNRQLAQEFGRDRSTVQHACEVIGQMREGSAECDASLRWMETMLRKAAGMAA
jgi:chromosomal replication initiation ATPase DnaA